VCGGERILGAEHTLPISASQRHSDMAFTEGWEYDYRPSCFHGGGDAWQETG